MVSRRRTLDARFSHFCSTGDPGALGEVFDGTARELLHVALWLAGNRADAEDLLQRTFLVAIETRGKFAAGRRVVPWLLGLLAREARHLRRERARSTPIAPEPQQGDPTADAATAELLKAIEEVRAKLAPQYQDVIHLHLASGLNAAEIAARLGRPAGTVRTQLVRALELLRQRLPQGFVAGLAPVTPDVAALASVKGAVITAAHRAIPTTAAAATTVAGGLLMSKKVVFVAPAALLALLLTATLTWPEVAPAEPNTPVTVSEVDAALATSEPMPGSVEDNPTRTPSRVAFNDQAIEADASTLRVSVRWQHDSSPAAGVGISALVSYYLPIRRDAITDENGICVLRGLRAGHWQITGSHTPDTGVELAPDRPAKIDMVATREALVRGTVVDDAGTPVSDAVIWLTDASGFLAQYNLTHSDRRGWFELPIPGKCMIGARKPGHVQSLGRIADPSAGDLEVELQLRGTDATVRGTVRGPDGTPVARARMLIGRLFPTFGSRSFDIQRVETMGQQILTDDHGRFEVASLRPGRLEVRTWARGCGPFQGHFDLLAGQTQAITIDLKTEAWLTGTVRDADGHAVGDATISIDAGDSARVWISTLSTETDAKGRYELRDLPGRQLRIIAAKDHRDARAALTFVPGQATTWDPVLAEGRPIAGVVLGPDSAPVPGVQIGHHGPDEALPSRAVRTDHAGRFLLRNVGEAAVTVRVGALDREAITARAHVLPGTELEIRLDARDLPTAHVRGVFVDEEGRPVAASIGIKTRGGIRFIRPVKTDAQGAFELGPIRPGPRELEVDTREHGKVLVDPVDLEPNATFDLGTIAVPRPGGAEFLCFDENGDPSDGVRVFVSWRKDARWGLLGQATTQAGCATIERLPPGRWRVTSDGDLEPAEVTVRSDETAVVEMRPPRQPASRRRRAGR